MNPWLIKIGVGVVISAAAYLFTVWTLRRNVPQLSCSYAKPGNYDGRNMKICCICLTEFSLLSSNNVISLPCRHKICRECCKKMFSFQVRNKRNCPQCRQIIPEKFVSLII